jgi:hypothetical protein
LDQTFSTAAWSSGRASQTPGERSAATATDRASLGSFLFTFPAASSRTRAPSLGCADYQAYGLPEMRILANSGCPKTTIDICL